MYWSADAMEVRVLVVNLTDQEQSLAGVSELVDTQVLLTTDKKTTAHAIPAHAAVIFESS